MRIYFQLTKLETDMTTYRQRMHEAFTREYPDIPVNEQRISDQRRTIVRNKLLSDEMVEDIKREVRTLLEEPTNDQTPTMEQVDETSEVHSENNITSNNETEEILGPDRQENNEATQQGIIVREIPTSLSKLVEDTFKEAHQKYSGINPTHRPWIPAQKTSRKLSQIVETLNEQVIPPLDIQSFQELHDVVYCAAYTAAKSNGAKIKEAGETQKNRTKQENIPPWKKRLISKVDIKRREIAQLTEYKKGTPSRKLEKKAQKIFEKYKVHSARDKPNSSVTDVIDTLKQKLAVFSTRLKRYSKCDDRKRQNSEFQYNEKRFYRNMKNGANKDTTPEPTSIPTNDQIRTYWSSLWTQSAEYNRDANWLRDEANEANMVTPMEEPEINVTLIKQVLANAHNWKSPGSDNVHNFWYKKLTSLHSLFAKYIGDFIKNPENVPLFLTEGKTYLLPKGKRSPDPSKYRPITCLQTFYKILTSCITVLLNAHIENENIMTEEQKGCRKGAKGCKEQLIIDSVILNHAMKKNRKLSCCYIDYQKAFDSVPHAWLLQVLKMYKIHPNIVNLLETLMKNWRTVIHITNEKQQTSSTSNRTDRGVVDPVIWISRGIYQGDSLSPLWFCLALNPLSKLIGRTGIGYALNSSEASQIISHQLYMDDLKLYASSHEKLNDIIQRVEQFSSDVGMKFGLDKCRVINLNRGKFETKGVQLDSGGLIESMNESDVYKYLGYEQARKINHTKIKETLTKEFMTRIKRACHTDLNSKNLVKTINTLAIPVLTYSFGIVKWTDTDLENLERKIRVELTRQRKHHPTASTLRINLPRSEGGRGIIHVKNLHNSQIKLLRKYFHEKQQVSPLHLCVCTVDKNYTPLNLASNENQRQEIISTQADRMAEWRSKALHGRHPHDIDQSHVDKQASNAWLVAGELFSETEGFMVAIQDQVIHTKNYMKHIIKDPNIQNDSCRRCRRKPETIQHVISGCSEMSQTDYLHRHNQVAAIIHQNLSVNLKLIGEKIPYYKYEPPAVLESAQYTLYFDRSIITDKTITNNRPDIVLRNKSTKTAFLIDIAVPNNHNVESTIVEKERKYIELKDEVKRLWSLETVTIVPIVISATGLIPQNLQPNLELLGINKNVFRLLQKAVILNTTRIVRKFLSINM